MAIQFKVLFISAQTNKKNYWPAWFNQMKKKKKRAINNFEAEMKRETSRYEVLHHLISLTFKSRCSAIDQIQEKDVSKVVMEQYPFLGNEKAVS